MLTRPSNVRSHALASSTAIAAASIRPRPCVVACQRLRARMTRKMPSRSKMPAVHAAAASPTLCPSTASASMPHARHNSTRLACSVKSAGCATSVRFRPRDRFVGEQRVEEADSAECPVHRIAALPHVAHDPLALIELTPHRPPLRALSAENEGDLRMRDAGRARRSAFRSTLATAPADPSANPQPARGGADDAPCRAPRLRTAPEETASLPREPR